MAIDALSVENLTGPRKTAIFLMQMGEEFAADFFQKLNEKQREKIAKYMSEITYVSSEILDVVMAEFVKNYENDANLLVSGKSFLRDVVDRSLDEKSARDFNKTLDGEALDNPFSDLSHLPAQNIVNLFSGEHPQTIALILSHLPEEKAAEILCLFPDEGKADIAYRIVQIGEVQDDLIRDLDDILRKELSGVGTVSRKFDGIETLASILNEVDSSTEESVLSHIENEDGDVAELIRQKMFVFEDLLGVDSKSFRDILQNVGNDVVAKAMKTASEELKEMIFGNLSERAGEMLREDLEVMGPTRLGDVEEAQQNIIRIAKSLEAEGKIVLAGKGKEDIYV